MSLPTVADLKIHLTSPGDEHSMDKHDTELADMLDAAVEMVGGLVGPITTATVTETHYGVASPALLLRQMPAATVSAVSSRSHGYTGFAGLPLSDYELDPSAGVLRMATGGCFYGDVTVTYSVGRPSVPADIRLAILIIAGHLWETQRGTAPSALALQGEDFAQPAVGAGYAIPNRAKDLLAPYIRPTIA